MSACACASVAEGVLSHRRISAHVDNTLGHVSAHNVIFLRRRKQNNFISDPISLYLSASQALSRALTREGLFDEN